MEGLNFVPKSEKPMDATLEQYLTTPFEELPRDVQDRIKAWAMVEKVDGTQTYH